MPTLQEVADAAVFLASDRQRRDRHDREPDLRIDQAN
jgi:hypothetical protein